MECVGNISKEPIPDFDVPLIKNHEVFKTLVTDVMVKVGWRCSREDAESLVILYVTKLRLM